MKRAPSPLLIAKLAAVPVTQQCTASITLGELVYGAYRFPGPHGYPVGTTGEDP